MIEVDTYGKFKNLLAIQLCTLDLNDVKTKW